jgi:hypothetical protein
MAQRAEKSGRIGPKGNGPASRPVVENVSRVYAPTGEVGIRDGGNNLPMV